MEAGNYIYLRDDEQGVLKTPLIFDQARVGECLSFKYLRKNDAALLINLLYENGSNQAIFSTELSKGTGMIEHNFVFS